MDRLFGPSKKKRGAEGILEKLKQSREAQTKMKPERVSTSTKNINPKPEGDFGRMRTDVGERVIGDTSRSSGIKTTTIEKEEPQQLQFDKEADERLGVGSGRDLDTDVRFGKLKERRPYLNHENPIDDPESFAKRVAKTETVELDPIDESVRPRVLETTVYKPKQTGARFGFTEEFQEEGPKVLQMLKK